MNNEGYQITYTGEEVQELLDKAGTAVQTETDPTVPSWAKAEEKPTYTATEVGALPEDTELFSGSYNDLTDKPTIPDSLSDLSDDSTHRLVTDAEKTEWNGKSDFSGSYNDLTDKPTIPAAQVNADWNATSGVAKILNKPTIPAEQIQSDWNQSNTSAKDYIKNKPTIPVVPSNVSAFTNDAGYITSYTETDPVFSASMAASITSADIASWNGKSDFSGSYNDLTDKPTIPTVPTTLSSFTDDLGNSPTHTHSQYLTSAPVTSVNGQTGAVSLSIPTVPTNISAFANDAGYTTNIGTVTSTGGTVAVNNIQVVSALPASPDANTLYLIPES